MKKRILATVAAIMLAATTVISAAYPASPEWEWELPKDGKILTGELFGTDPYGAGAEFDKAWDGDTSTFFDPQSVGEANYTGVKLDQAYILTEIRIMPRENWLDRFNGATIQGSNDGENWTDIFISIEAAVGYDYVIIAPDKFETGSNTGYSMYRYVNNTNHGDVAEVELYGNPAAAAAEPEPEPAPVVEETPAPAEEAPAAVEVAPAEEVAPAAAPAATTAPATGDITVIVACVAVAALALSVVLKKRTAK